MTVKKAIFDLAQEMQSTTRNPKTFSLKLKQKKKKPCQN